MTYQEQLLTQNWKIKRKIILERDNYSCTICKNSKTLQVHHKKYIFGRMAWDYPDRLLQTLCRNCHEEVHKNTIIKSERDLLKIKPKEKIKIKPQKKRKLSSKEKMLNKLSKEERRIQSMWDAIKLKNKKLKKND